MKVLKKYTDLFSANLAKGALEAAGIPAAILNENMGFITAAVNTDLLSIELAVDDSNYDEALKIINAEFKNECENQAE